MGRDSGYIAIQSGIAGGAELVMVPETFTPLEEVIETLKEGWNRSKTSSIIIVAEGEEGGATEIGSKVKKNFPQPTFALPIWDIFSGVGHLLLLTGY